MKYCRNYIRFLTLTLLLMIVAACGEIDPWAGECISGSDFGQLVEKEITVNAHSAAVNGDWTNSGMSVTKGKPIQIVTTGTANLCHNGVVEFNSTNFPASTSGWFDSGIILSDEQTYEISDFAGQYSRWPVIPSGVKQHNGLVKYCSGYDEDEVQSGLGLYIRSEWNCENEEYIPYCRCKSTRHQCTIKWVGAACESSETTCSSKVNSVDDASRVGGDCFSREGKGLFVYIGDTPPDASDWGTHTATIQPLDGVGTYGMSSSRDDDSHYFEMYDWTNSKVGVFSGQTGDIRIVYNNQGEAMTLNLNPYLSQVPVPRAGKLWFRYYDRQNGSDDFANTSYAGNQGGYTFKVKRQCYGTEGMFMLGYVGSNPPDKIVQTDSEGNEINLLKNRRILNLHEAALTTLTLDYGDGDTVEQTGVYNDAVPETGILWFKIIDEKAVDWNDDDSPDNIVDDNYNNNNGSYYLHITTTKDDDILGGILYDIVDPVRDILLGDYDDPNDHGLAKKIFNNVLGNDNGFIDAVRATMVLAVTLFALTYMIGITNVTQKEIIGLAFKVAIVQQLISPGAWEFFHTHLFVIFMEGVDEMIFRVTDFLGTVMAGAEFGGNVGAAAGAKAISKDTWGFLDQMLMRIYSVPTFAKMTALMSPEAFPMGLLYGILIIMGSVFFTLVVAYAVFVYVMSLIGVAIMLAVSPIFLSFLVLSKKGNIFESMFNNWWKYMVSFAIQPILMFTLLALFGVFIYALFFKLMSFSACWTSCAGQLDLPITELIGLVGQWLGIPGATTDALPDYDKVCLWPGYVPWNMGGRQGFDTQAANLPVNLFIVLTFLIMIATMFKFITWVTQFANTFATVGRGGVDLNNVTTGALVNATKTGAIAAFKGPHAVGSRVYKHTKELAEKTKQSRKATRDKNPGNGFEKSKEQLEKAKQMGKEKYKEYLGSDEGKKDRDDYVRKFTRAKQQEQRDNDLYDRFKDKYKMPKHVKEKNQNNSFYKNASRSEKAESDKANHIKYIKEELMLDDPKYKNKDFLDSVDPDQRDQTEKEWNGIRKAERNASSQREKDHVRDVKLNWIRKQEGLVDD